MNGTRSEIVGGIDMGSDQSGLGAAPGSRLEVAILERDGKPLIALHLSTFTEALGWQVQKTIPISSDKIAQLQRLLIESRNRLASDSTIGRVIPFSQRTPFNSDKQPPSDASSAQVGRLERAG